MKCNGEKKNFLNNSTLLMNVGLCIRGVIRVIK